MSKHKMQEDFHTLLTQIGGKANYEINVANFATVISYDKAKHTADVQPQVDDAGGQDDVGIINDCPVLYQCYAIDELREELGKSAAQRTTMKTGATVYIVFNDRDLDNFNGNGKYTKASDRTHDINDAVVVGVYEK